MICTTDSTPARHLTPELGSGVRSLCPGPTDNVMLTKVRRTAGVCPAFFPSANLMNLLKQWRDAPSAAAYQTPELGSGVGSTCRGKDLISSLQPSEHFSVRSTRRSAVTCPWIHELRLSTHLHHCP